MVRVVTPSSVHFFLCNYLSRHVCMQPWWSSGIRSLIIYVIGFITPSEARLARYTDAQNQALAQQIFFTASAPLTGKHVNLSPKGLPSTTFSIFDPKHASYVDATGSGSETISHLYENGRITIMFCSFSATPRILRFFCMGTVVEWDEPSFEPLIRKMGKERIAGARAVILLDVFKVGISPPHDFRSSGA